MYNLDISPFLQYNSAVAVKIIAYSETQISHHIFKNLQRNTNKASIAVVKLLAVAVCMNSYLLRTFI